MNPIKFLRKYTRVLLMVFMSLLLIAFLVPSQIQGCASNARRIDPELGKAFGKAIHESDRMKCLAEMRVIQQLGFLPAQLNLDPLVYYLLVAEAERAGIQTGVEEVKELLRQRRMTNDQLARIQRDQRISYDDIYEIAGKWLSVRTLMDLQASGVADTLPRRQTSYRDTTQKAVARMSLIDARGFAHRVSEPTEEQLVAFFEEFKAEEPGDSESELQFGYRLPDRVRVEYLTVDPADVVRKVTVKSSQVRRYFEENSNKYMKSDPTVGPPAASAAPPPQVPMTFEEAEDQVREDFRMIKAIDEAQRLVNELHEAVYGPWRPLDRGEEGFRAVPAEPLVSFESLRDEFSERYPVLHQTTDLVDYDLLQGKPLFGDAFVTVNRRPVSVADLAFRVKGLAERAEGDVLPLFNVMEPGPVVVAPDVTGQHQVYQAFVFRVTEVKPSAPPDSIDEVRVQVEEDWRDWQAFEMAREHAEKLAARAREIGLEAALAEATELRETLSAGATAATQPAAEGTPPQRKPRYAEDLEIFTPNPIGRRDSMVVPRVGRTSTLPSAVLELTADLQDESVAHAVTAAPLANQLKWVVAELDELKPLYAGEFEQQVQMSASQLRRGTIQAFQSYWIAPQNVVERTGFESALPDPNAL